MSRLPIRVVKVGGSLFDLPDLADRLQSWLAAQPPAHQVLVAGGGALAEQVRAWHKRRPLSDEASHWMCIDLMAVTARLLHDCLPAIPLVRDDRLLCQLIGNQGCTIFDPGEWLRASEPHLPSLKLPTSWDVTSDAIAARLAIVLPATELVLLKSTLPANMKSTKVDQLSELATMGIVDAMLPRLAPELPSTRLVDLRNARSLTVG